ncbi:MAG TPA: EAL domain-containing protein, partial [Pyrinomonadaceae bacterium]|nr:EAL domain-containing protein [Pyrinomonadaceae bacterium]
LLLFGGEAATLLAAAEGVCSSLRISRKPLTIFFNAAALAVSTFVTASVLRLCLGAASEVSDEASIAVSVTTVCVMALAQYVANSGLVALDRSFKDGQAFWPTWRRHYLWTSVTYLIGATAAGVTVRLISEFGFYPVALVMPVIAVVYFTYKTYLQSVETAAAQAEQAKLHVDEQSRYITELERIRRELQESREHFRHAANHDALTGLPNRAMLTDRLRLAIERSKRHGDFLFAVLFLDLDRFKNVNDSLGHLAGDHLLIEVARRLENALRPTDTVARLGGDEFALLLDGIDDYSDALRVAERVQREINLPMLLKGNEVYATASIGIAMHTKGYDHPENILRDADTALYRAKENGKARHELFDEGMHASAVALLQLESGLRRALDRREFEVHYQPIISLEKGEIIAFESLVRWRHAERGLVPPAEFIPVAEETGLILELGELVLRESCRQMREWQDKSLVGPTVSLSVNLSGKQFTQPNLAGRIRQVLVETGLDPCSLVLEITESVVMNNAELACATLRQLRDLGIRLSIDDFGTGYSSLSYLHRFPVNTLKIDRSFISGMGNGDENSEIIGTIIKLAGNLGMEVVAEGVETESQRRKLRAMRCGYAQGFLFHRPASAEATETMLAERPIERSDSSRPPSVGLLLDVSDELNAVS